MIYLFILSLLLAGYANAAGSSVQSLTDSSMHCLDWGLNGTPGTAVEQFSFLATDFGFPSGTTYIPINSVTVTTKFRKYDEGDANFATNPQYQYYGNANVAAGTGNGCPPNTSPFYTCLNTPTHTDAVFFSECVFKIQRPSGTGAFLINKQWDSVSTDNTVRTVTFTDSASVSAGSIPVPIDGTSYKPVDSFGSFLADATNPDGTLAYNLAANALGTWSLTITDSGTYDPTCYVQTVLTVKINLILDGSVTPPKCAGSSDGIITVTAQGGSGQYQIYQVKTGGVIGNMQVTGLPAGTYAVFVKELNGNGAIGTKTFNLTDYAAVQGSAQISNPITCSSSSDGQITITPSGGTGTYRIVSINPSAGAISSMVISNLPSGTYTVTIADSNNCQFVISNIQLTAPTPVAVTVSQQPSCDTAKVTLSGSGGNGGPYTLSSLPASWGSGTCAGTVPALTYCGPAGSGLQFQLKDSKNCIGTSASVTLKLLSISVTKSDAVCAGQQGTITVTMSDSTLSSPSYGATVNGASQSGKTTTFSVPAGVYTVSGTDGQCTVSYGSVTINQPSDISTSETILNCPDKYGIQISPSGGPAGATYSITTTATVVKNTSPFIVQVPTNASFTYTISAGACSATFSTYGSGLFTTAFAISPILQSLPCLGKSYSFSHSLTGGTGTITATGVTSPTTTSYTTSANAVQITTQAPSTLASPYYFAVAVAVRDASLCSGSVTVTEQYPQGIPSSSDIATLLCYGDSMDIPINIVQPAGYPNNFFVSAAGPPSTISVKNANTVTVSNQIGTSQVYPIKFNNTDSCGLYNTGTLTVTQPSVVTFSPSTYTYKCYGPTESFTITLSYSGYFVSQTSTPNTFTITAISPNTGGATVTPLGGNDFSVTVPKPTSTTTYTLTAITNDFVDSGNTKNCSYPLTLTVSPATTSPLTASAADSSCYNTPKATITITGGTSPFTLSYTRVSTGATSIPVTVASPATVTLPAFDTYTFTIVDSKGCSTTVNGVTLTNPPQIALTQTVTVYKCPGQGGSPNSRIDLAPYLTGGTGTLCATTGASCYSHPGPSCTLVRIPVSSTPTSCSVTIADGRGCTQNVPIQEAIAPSISATTTFSAGICPGNLVTMTVGPLTGAAPASGGGYSVAVTVASVTKTVTDTQKQSFTFSGVAGGTVTLQFTDNNFWPGQPGDASTKCSNSHDVTIPNLPVDTINPSPATLMPKCYGDPVSSLSPSSVSFSGTPSPPYTLNSVTPSELCGSPTFPITITALAPSVNLCPTQFTNYVFSFTDSNSCTVTSTVTVSPNTNSISVAPVVMPCDPSTTINVTPVFSGGPGPTYTINSVKDKNNAVVTVSGTAIQGVTYNNSTYTINVKSCDSATPTPLCCTQDVLLNSLYQPLQATFTTTIAPCPSQANGKIRVTVTNGSGNPSIASVTPGPQTVNTVSATVFDIINLLSGTYTIVINDATAFCQYTLSATLNNGPDLSLSVTDKSCGNVGNYDFTMNSGRSGSAYTITGTPTTFSSNVAGNVIRVTGLTFGQTYNFVITDTSTGCVVNQPITSNTQPYAVTYSTIPSLACFGDKTSVQLHVVNGSNPGSVNITSVTSPATYSPTLLVSNIPAGNTVVNFQDYYGCTFSTTLSVNGPSQITLTPNGNALTCPGVPQTFTFTGSGGTGGLYSVTSFEITGVTPANPPTFVAGTLQLDTVSAGTYSINFQANLNNTGQSPPTACSRSTSFTVTQSPFVVTTNPSPAVISCNTITQANQLAVVQLQVSGSAGAPYTIDCTSFLTAYPTAGCDSSTMTLSNLGDSLLNTGASTQSYSVTVSDKINCAYIYTFVVQRPSVINVNKTPHPTSCSASSDGSLDITITGGVPPYYVNAALVTSQPYTITGLSAGTGQITVKDSANPLQTASSGCTIQVSYVITSPPALSVSFVDKSCNDQPKFSVSTTGAQGSWSIITVSPSPVTIQGGTTVSANTWASYTVTVKDSKNCQASNSITLAQPQPLAITPTSYQLVCSSPSGSESQAFICTGGTSSSTCTISTVSPASMISGLTISQFGVGAINIGLIDGNGCRNSVQFNVLPGPTITATVTPSTPTTSCFGVSDATASFSGNNGLAPYAINSLVGGPYNTPLSGLSVSGLQGGKTYSVTLKDSNNCVSSILSFNVNQPNPISGTLQDYSCYNNGRIRIQPFPSAGVTVQSVQGNTGTPAYTYNNGEILISGLNFGQSTTVKLQDSNGCITTLGPTTLNNPNNVVAQSITRTSTTCPGGSDGSVQFLLVGGTGSLSITSPTTNVSFSNPYWQISYISAASFPVTVTDARSCQYTITMFTTQPNSFSISYVPHPQPTCASTHDGSADFSISGSNGGPFSVVAVTPQDASGEPSFVGTTVNAVDGASYTVTVQDSKGCLANTTMQITPLNIVSINIGAKNSVTCAGGNNGGVAVYASGISPYTITVTPTLQPSQILPIPNQPGAFRLQNLAAGTYTITIKDGSGCSGTETVIIAEPPPVTGVASTTQIISCEGFNDGVVRVPVTGGTTSTGIPQLGYTFTINPIVPYTFVNDNIFKGFVLTNLKPGIYTYTISDLNSCAASNSFTLTEPILRIINPVQHQQWPMYLRSIVEWSYIPDQHGNDIQLNIILENVNGQKKLDYGVYSALTTPNNQFEYYPHNIYPGIYYVVLNQSNGCPRQVSYPLIITARPNGPDGYVGKMP